MDVGKKDILIILESYDGKADFDTIKSKFGELQPQQISYLWAHLRDLLEFGDIMEGPQKVYSLTKLGEERNAKRNYSWKNCYDKQKKENIKKAEWI